MKTFQKDTALYPIFKNLISIDKREREYLWKGISEKNMNGIQVPKEPCNKKTKLNFPTDEHEQDCDHAFTVSNGHY